MILGVNGLWGFCHVFQWIHLFFFILMFLCFAGIKGKTFNKYLGSAQIKLIGVVPRCRQIVDILDQSGTYMTALEAKETNLIFDIDFPLDGFRCDWKEAITSLSSEDSQCQQSKRQELEEQWNNSSVSAKIECDRNYVFKLADELAEAARQRMFPELISCMGEVIQKIGDFHNDYSASISRDEQHIDIFQVLDESYAVFRKSFENLESAIDCLNGELKQPGKQKHQIKKTAEMYEVVAFELKDHARFLSIETLSRLVNSAGALRDMYAAELNENVDQQNESKYKSKRRIWVASCTIRASIMDVMQESSQEFGVFENKEEARSVMNVSSESEYRNFLSELDDDW